MNKFFYNVLIIIYYFNIILVLSLHLSNINFEGYLNTILNFEILNTKFIKCYILSVFYNLSIYRSAVIDITDDLYM